MSAALIDIEVGPRGWCRARSSASPASARWPCRSAPCEGVRRGCRAIVRGRARRRAALATAGSAASSTRMGEPIDGKGPLPHGPDALSASAPSRRPPMRAAASGEPLDLGVRALNTFTTCCRGQRMGIFAGSGVGKSVLLSMLARNASADVAVIGLVGERGREVQEFLQDDLGEEGLRALHRRGRDLRRAGADAPPGRLPDAGAGRALPRPGRCRCCA